MNSLVFAIATVCTQQPAPPLTVVAAYNKDKTFKAILSLPTRSSWADSISGHIRLQNVSAESRYVYDILWPTVTVHYENVGKPGMWGMWNYLVITEQFPLTNYLLPLAPTEAITQVVHRLGWDFDRAPNGVYNVVIAFDDSQIWPDNISSQRVGRISFPLTLKLTDGHLEIAERSRKSGERSRGTMRYITCFINEPQPVSRRDRALKRRSH